MSVFQQLYTVPAKAGCITIFCPKSIPEKLIDFHRTIICSQISSQYRVILLQDCDIEELFAQLAITFLGEAFIYALKDSDISVAQRKKLDAFLKDYLGPHYVYFFTSEPHYEKNGLVLESAVNKKTFQELAAQNGHKALAPSFIDKLYAERASYTFDESIMLMRYANLLGSRHDIFFSEWLNRILVDDISLFTLSQYFFAQQRQLLMAEWARLKDQYPTEFWIAFFSEQLWQATLYIQYAAAGKAAEAKRHAYRLPFSFFQKDYKRYTRQQLAQAHEFLYTVDHGLKNGYATDGLEIFIHSAFR
jgi:hypothetical protein